METSCRHNVHGVCAGAMAKSGDYLAGIDMPSSGSDEESDNDSEGDSGGMPASAAARERSSSGAGPAEASADGSAGTPQAAVELGAVSCRQGAVTPAGGLQHISHSTTAAADHLSRLGVES
jgi:hypothetical protein